MGASRTYFAAKSRPEIGEALIGKLESLKRGNADDNSAEVTNAIAHYYGKQTSAGLTWGVTRAGDKGKLAAFRINSARAYAKAFLALVTSAKVTWRPQASNGDAGAAAATTLAANLLEDLWKNQQLAGVYQRWVEQAIVCATAYVFDEWDKGAGPPLMASGERLVKQGDITLHNLLPSDVKIDSSAPSYRQCSWRYVRLWKNKFDLAKLCTQLADGRTGDEAEDAILSASDSSAVHDYSGSRARQSGATGEDEDLCPVWYFFHDKTPALPAGRETVFISANCVLRDGRLSYDAAPVHRLCADEMFDSPHGWGSFWDMLGVQEVRDGIQTTLATIVQTLGNPSLALEQGSEIRSDDIVAGFQAVRYPRGSQPPKTLQLAEFPPDALKYEDSLEQKQRMLMGLDELSAGQFQGKELNAQAFAVLTSLTTQKASPFQTSALAALSELGSSMLRTYHKRVSHERQLKITGKASKNLYAVERWTGAALEAIDGVLVDIGNPSEQTAAGRATVLQNLMAVPGAVTTPEEVQQVLDTGRLESATRSVRDELLLLKTEFEMLQEGKAPPVHHLQNHVLHYRENGSVLYSPEALANPSVLQAVEAHLAEHYLAQYAVPREADPLRPLREAFLMGRQPDPTLMPPAPGMGPPPPGGAPPGPGMAPGPSGAPGAPPPDVNAGPVEPPPPDLPELPTDPATGHPLEIATGPMQ